MLDVDIEDQVSKHAQKKHKNNHNLQELKLSMVNFDEKLFNHVYKSVLDEKGFSETFNKLISPFLLELGNLWQSKTINVAHEHFICNLIKQKMLLEIERLYRVNIKYDFPLFILFLPENEMHDLGLLFLNYKLLDAGYRTVFLGASMQLDSLTFFQRNGQQPIFVTFITVQPTLKKLPKFLEQFNIKLNDAPLLLLGRQTHDLDKSLLTSNQKIFTNIDKAVEYLQEH